MIKFLLYIKKIKVVFKENDYVLKVRCEECRKINKIKEDFIN